MKTQAEQIREIESLLSSYDRRFAAAFLEGIRVIAESVSLSAIAEELRAHNVAGVLSLFNDALIAAGFITFSRTLQDAMIAGGDYASRIASANRIEFGFSVAESNTARFLQGYQAERIRQIAQEMRETISQIIYREASAGRSPIATARLIKENLGLTAHQESAVENYRRYLEEGDRRALENRLRDARYDPTVARSIKEGVPPNKVKINAMVDAYRRRYINRRAQTIARTESMAMIQSGQDQYWKQMVQAGVAIESEIRRKWIVTRDSKLRDAHAAIPALNKDGVGLNEPFRSPLGMIRYPGDPSASAANRINCRCALFTRIERA